MKIVGIYPYNYGIRATDNYIVVNYISGTGTMRGAVIRVRNNLLEMMEIDINWLRADMSTELTKFYTKEFIARIKEFIADTEYEKSKSA